MKNMGLCIQCKSDLVWISNGQKEVGLQMVQISNGIWNLEAQPFEICTYGRHFVKNHLKSGQKHLDFEWSSLWMVDTIAIAIAKAPPYETRTICNRTFKMSGFQMFQDFKKLDFLIPTVYFIRIRISVLQQSFIRF